MTRFRNYTFIMLTLLLAAACQPAGPEDPNTGQDPTRVSGPDVEVTGIQKLEDALVAAGAEVAPDSDVEQPFFSVPGQVLLVNGEALQVFEYTSPALADAEAAQVAPDGTSIGTVMPNWIGPPHFFRTEELIALYVGENQAIIDLLETVLGDQFAGAASLQEPSMETQPPAATLLIADDDQTSGIGTYCWTEPDAELGLCVDKIGIPTSPDPLQVTAPFVTRLSIPLTEQPDILALTTIPETPEDQMPTEIDGLRWWPPGPGDQFELPLEQPHELELSLAPGLYVLSIFAQWQDIGDVNYGFLVEVLPSPSAEASSGEDTVSAVVILAAAGLNLRTGPNTAAEIVGILSLNELVPVFGVSPDGDWWQVACPEGTAGDCWISADPRWSEPATP